MEADLGADNSVWFVANLIRPTRYCITFEAVALKRVFNNCTSPHYCYHIVILMKTNGFEYSFCMKRRSAEVLILPTPAPHTLEIKKMINQATHRCLGLISKHPSRIERNEYRNAGLITKIEYNPSQELTWQGASHGTCSTALLCTSWPAKDSYILWKFGFSNVYIIALPAPISTINITTDLEEDPEVVLFLSQSLQRHRPPTRPTPRGVVWNTVGTTWKGET